MTTGHARLRIKRNFSINRVWWHSRDLPVTSPESRLSCLLLYNRLARESVKMDPGDSGRLGVADLSGSRSGTGEVDVSFGSIPQQSFSDSPTRQYSSSSSYGRPRHRHSTSGSNNNFNNSHRSDVTESKEASPGLETNLDESVKVTSPTNRGMLIEDISSDKGSSSNIVGRGTNDASGAVGSQLRYSEAHHRLSGVGQVRLSSNNNIVRSVAERLDLLSSKQVVTLHNQVRQTDG